MEEPNLFYVDAIAHGGDGIVREGGRAIFVPAVLPGEKVSIKIVPGRGKVMRAELIEVAAPSPHRVEPACPYYSRCGGCRLQHAEYSYQIELKREIIKDAFNRIGGMDIQPGPAVPSPIEYGYRSRTRFHVKKGRPGFFGERKSEFVPVDKCLISSEAINYAIDPLKKLVKKSKASQIEVIDDPDRGVLAVLITGREHKIMKLSGDRWEKAADERVFFTQVNPGQNRNLREIVRKLADEAGPENVIELYAGAGNLTGVLLEKSRKVTAVESDPEAVEEASDVLGNSENLRLVTADAGAFLDSEAEKFKADLVVLDPPRTGAREAVPGILRLGPSHIIYVSCDPATLARDAAMLVDGGYSVESVVPLDMFPQTAQVEAVTLFRKNR